MNAYYNEHDRFAAAWLRELIRDGLIPAGDVDERDIQLVQPADLAGYDACHFFAGIGGWAYALRLAGWPEDRPVWTGSCPCQPFSAAGKGARFDDSRHLWPSWFRLIRECRPPVVFGEQVASADGLAWFDTVSTDLEAEAYAVGAADLAAASVGAPHLRQRLFFVADSRRGSVRQRDGLDMAVPPGGTAEAAQERERLRADARHGSRTGVALGDTTGSGWQTERHAPEECRRDADSAGAIGCTVGVPHGAAQQARRGQSGRTAARSGEPSRPGGDSALADSQRHDGRADEQERGQKGRAAHGRVGSWADLEWLSCTDGKARPTKPGIFPLAHGIPNRVGTLRGAGNAIVPAVAAQFIRAYLEVTR